jgi:hypothetical protein
MMPSAYLLGDIRCLECDRMVNGHAQFRCGRALRPGGISVCLPIADRRQRSLDGAAARHLSRTQLLPRDPRACDLRQSHAAHDRPRLRTGVGRRTFACVSALRLSRRSCRGPRRSRWDHSNRRRRAWCARSVAFVELAAGSHRSRQRCSEVRADLRRAARIDSTARPLLRSAR